MLATRHLAECIVKNLLGYSPVRTDLLPMPNTLSILKVDPPRSISLKTLLMAISPDESLYSNLMLKLPGRSLRPDSDGPRRREEPPAVRGVCGGAARGLPQ